MLNRNIKTLNAQLYNTIKQLPDCSYTKYLLLTKNKNRETRRKALKRFLDATRS